MKKIVIKNKYSCLFFGEGKKDKIFLNALVDNKKFQYHTANWVIKCDNASGSSPKIILEQCRRTISNYSYDLILCFIDLDKLKNDFPKKWEKEKMKLEEQYFKFKIIIIWQFDNAEDEYKKVIGDQCKSKHKLNKIAKQKIKEFINSDFWKRILGPIKNKEEEFEKNGVEGLEVKE